MGCDTQDRRTKQLSALLWKYKRHIFMRMEIAELSEMLQGKKRAVIRIFCDDELRMSCARDGNEK
jgi:hypothetical protein